MANRWHISIVVLLGLVGCTAADQDQIARETARATVTPMLEERFPGVPVAPAANCMIDNASGQEIITLAAASVTGVTTNTTRVFNDVLRRPETLNCIANEGLTLLLMGGV